MIGWRNFEPNAVGLLRILLVAAFVAPVSLFAAISWIDYERLIEETESDLRQLSEIGREHTDKIFDSYKLIGDEANEFLRNLSDDQIRAQEVTLHDRLAASVEDLPQVSGIWVVDRSGRLLASATTYPVNPALDFSDREYFTALRDSSRQTFVNRVYVGRSDGKSNFGLSRRRIAADHGFDGLINISVDPDFFVDFFGTLVGGDDDTVDLVREDGEMLSGYPAAHWPMSQLAADDPFRAAIGRQSKGLYRVPASGSRSERLIAFSKLDDYPIYVAVGRPLSQIVTAWHHAMASHLLIGVPGTIALVLLTLTALRGARREQAALAQIRDETKRREVAEGALRQAQKMEAVGQLTGGIAHDFNNILTIIAGNIDMARRAVAGRDEKLVRLLDAALRGSDRAASLTRRLLAFARRQALEPAVIDVNKQVGSMSELVRRILGETIEVETVLAGGLWHSFCDPNELESVLLNLVLNARDAMRAGGKLTIETQNALLDEAYAERHAEVVAGQYVMVSISDTGSGMPQEVLAQAFEPFFTTKPPGEGSGLGLSMVYGFVKQSGGHIKIYSEIGQGTVVKLYLPRHFGAELPSRQPDARADLPRTAEQRLVLVVEDDPDVREYSVRVLGELGYQVIEASDGPSAITLLEAGHPVDLLFTDVVLPTMNGRELARHAAGLRPGLKVIFTTGYTRNAIIHAGRLDPDVVLVPKPFTPETLAKRVRAVFGETED